MDTERAARKLVRAVVRRRREAVITAHGKLSVFLERHLPAATARLARSSGLSTRRRRPK